MSDRPSWRSVGVPREHGGWGLTLEPVLLGLLVAASWPGLLIGIAAFAAFLVRTPLKLAGIDARRHQWRDRSRRAARLAAVELAVLVAAAGFAVALGGWEWTIVVAFAAPLVAIELWFDLRSRSRRLLPELCGAVGIAAAGAAIVLADPTPLPDQRLLAGAVWAVLAARSIATIPFARTKVLELHRGPQRVAGSDAAQLAGLVVAVLAAVVEPRVVAGAVAVGVIAAAQLVLVRRPAPPVKVLGIAQMVLGLLVAAATATGIHLA